MTWHYGIRDGRLAEIFTDLPPHAETGSTEGYAILGWRDTWHILRDLRWVVRGVRWDRRQRKASA